MAMKKKYISENIAANAGMKKNQKILTYATIV